MQISITLVALIALFTALERWRPGLLHRSEEILLALLLATMVLVSFVQVIARYVFLSGWDGALEFTRILFAWLILFGMSYGIRANLHIGVDALVRLLPKPLFRLVALATAGACVLYAVVFLYSDWLQLFGAPAKGGAMDYWSKMFRAGIGLEDLRFPDWAQQAFGLDDRVPRWVAYLILPVGLALFAFRCLEAMVAMVRGERELIIASHEAEDLVAENRAVAKD